MPVENIGGVDLAHEMPGGHAPLVTLTRGGRHGGGTQRALASLITEAGFRVLLHDTRHQEILTSDVDADIDFEDRAGTTGTLGAAFVNLLHDCERSR